MSQQQLPPQSQQQVSSQSGQSSFGSQSSMGQSPMIQGQSSMGQVSSGQQSQGLSAPVGRRFSTQSYLPENVRSTSMGLLNQCLADLTAVNMQLKGAHWNVKGQEFYQLHELFEDLTETFEEHIDMVAERVTALGGQAMGTAYDVVQNTTIPQLSQQSFEGTALLQELAYRLSLLDAKLGQQIKIADQQGDLDTADLLNEVSRDVSEAQWFIEAHLQSGSGQSAVSGQSAGGVQSSVGGQQQLTNAR